MELGQVVAPLYAFPVFGVMLCVVLVFAFGFKPSVQPPSFDFGVDKKTAANKKRKPKKSSQNGHIAHVSQHNATTPLKENSGKSSAKEQNRTKTPEPKDKQRRLEITEKKTEKFAKLKILNSENRKEAQKNEDDFGDGEWKQQLSRKEKKNRKKDGDEDHEGSSRPSDSKEGTPDKKSSSPIANGEILKSIDNKENNKKKKKKNANDDVENVSKLGRINAKENKTLPVVKEEDPAKDKSRSKKKGEKENLEPTKNKKTKNDTGKLDKTNDSKDGSLSKSSKKEKKNETITSAKESKEKTKKADGNKAKESDEKSNRSENAKRINQNVSAQNRATTDPVRKTKQIQSESVDKVKSRSANEKSKTVNETDKKIVDKKTNSKADDRENVPEAPTKSATVKKQKSNGETLKEEQKVVAREETKPAKKKKTKDDSVPEALKPANVNKVTDAEKLVEKSQNKTDKSVDAQANWQEAKSIKKKKRSRHEQ